MVRAATAHAQHSTACGSEFPEVVGPSVHGSSHAHSAHPMNASALASPWPALPCLWPSRSAHPRRCSRAAHHWRNTHGTPTPHIPVHTHLDTRLRMTFSICGYVMRAWLPRWNPNFSCSVPIL